MKDSHNWKSIILAIYCSILLILQIYFASQVYSGLSIETVESPQIFKLDSNGELAVFSNINVKNTFFQSSNGIIEVSARRDLDNSSKAIFDVQRVVAIPLRHDLGISFSIFAEQLDPDFAAGRLYLIVTNGSRTIFLNYVVGQKETDWKTDTNAYVFYQVGTNANVWYKYETNIWNDLANKNLTLDYSWHVTSVLFGCISYWKEPKGDNEMRVLLNASETSLHYETTTFTEVIPTLQISWIAVYLMIANTVLVLVPLGILLKSANKKELDTRVSDG
jgi:hypothetical protein